MKSPQRQSPVDRQLPPCAQANERNAPREWVMERTTNSRQVGASHRCRRQPARGRHKKQTLKVNPVTRISPKSLGSLKMPVPRIRSISKVLPPSLTPRSRIESRAAIDRMPLRSNNANPATVVMVSTSIFVNTNSRCGVFTSAITNR